MLDERRIREAKNNVKSYLSEGLLRKTDFDRNIFHILRKNAQESLQVAALLARSRKSSLWVIVTSYYSMFYVANALLYRLGFKIGERISHKVTSDALIALARDRLRQSLIENYEETRDQALATMKSDELVQYFDFERRKRSLVQYQTPEEIRLSRVETSLRRAREFVFEIEKLLEAENGQGQPRS